MSSHAIQGIGMSVMVSREIYSAGKRRLARVGRDTDEKARLRYERYAMVMPARHTATSRHAEEEEKES